ncbi:toprim domain-containing protein [Catellatospora bangladeshensis]|uniref:toprim domain-containing protein n=3 Tax=Catellatospora bangladeshensis TaxID=310355 RepID=UPI003607E00A
MTVRAQPASRAMRHTAMLTLRLAIADLTSAQAWARLLDVAARHPGRGVHDVLLIARQRPDATELGTYEQWRARGAHVRRGERGITLLQARESGEGSDAVTAFDVAQTDAVPAPREPVPDLVPVVSALAAMADAAGLSVRLGQGLDAAVHAEGDHLDLAAEQPLSASAGHLVHHLARRLLPPGPARELQAAGAARVVARRFGLRPPEIPAAGWTAALGQAPTDRAVVETTERALRAAGALTARLLRTLDRRALDRPTTPPPVPRHEGTATAAAGPAARRGTETIPAPSGPAARRGTETIPAASGPAARRGTEAIPAPRRPGGVPTPSAPARRALTPATSSTQTPRPSGAPGTSAPAARRGDAPPRSGAARPDRGSPVAPRPSAAGLAALYAANAAAAEFYAAHLPGSRAAAAYLRSHGIASAAEAGGAWQLGVAPAGEDALLRHLRERGFAEQVLLDAGLVAVSRLHGGGLYDVFRDRLMFPVHAPGGQIAGFTGRDLSGRSFAKFRNTADTPAFHKSELLYGLTVQTAGSDAPDRIVVVEGPTDAIAARLIYQGPGAGGTRTVAVASCGTAFTRAQLDLLTRAAGPHTSLVMSFDADRAGTRALERAYPLAVTWPHGPVTGTRPAGHKDIADLLAARGPDRALRDLLAAERPLPLLGVRQALAKAFGGRFNPAWPEDRVRAYRTIAPYLLDAVGQDQVDLLVRAAAQRLGLDPHEVADGVVAHFAAEHERADQRR